MADLPKPITRKETYLNAAATGDTSSIPSKPLTREEEYLQAIAEGAGGGDDPVSYTTLTNKPKINGVEVVGDLTSEDIGLANVLYWIGVTTTELDDNSTTNPIIINGKEVTAKIGGTAQYEDKEFAWNGNTWQKLGDKALVFDTEPKSDSKNPVTSNGVYKALDEKQDKLTFDPTPTERSNNPVTSDGIKKAINDVASSMSVDIATMNKAGIVKPDGISILVDPDGTIHAQSSGVSLDDVSGATATIEREVASLKWTDPTDVVVSNVTLAAWAGTKVVKKSGSAPENVGDGILVADVKTRNQYSSTTLVDEKAFYDNVWYYRFFPYTDKGTITVGTSVSVSPMREVVELPNSLPIKYDGDPHTPQWVGYDAEKITLVEEIAETEEGIYFSYFEPSHDYMWSDQTIEKKEIKWEIIVAHIYGVKWDGTSSTVLSRTDDAVGFTDPNPYYANMTGKPNSPFDNISPWKDMRIVEDTEAGTLVEIPKFWFYVNGGGNSPLEIKISQFEQTDDNWYVSPAHMDRGDGQGERDFVYIGRYHSCFLNEKTPSLRERTPLQLNSNYSISECLSLVSKTADEVYELDFATLYTIWLLYIVEFANWNSQEKIGYGCSKRDGTTLIKKNTGYTDIMPYHTGTICESRTVFEAGTQYRYIEGLWDDYSDLINGIKLYQGSNSTYYININPKNTRNGDTTSILIKNTGYISKIQRSNVSNFKWVVLPCTSTNTGTSTTYIPDTITWYLDGSSYKSLFIHALSDNFNGGLFGMYFTDSLGGFNNGIRIMKLPNNS